MDKAIERVLSNGEAPDLVLREVEALIKAKVQASTGKREI
jgi:hypothetical protein